MQDDDNIYFVMEYVAGGELFAHLRSADAHRFKEPRAKFYAAELILALRHMHEVENIVYRDLKPENMLIDKDGMRQGD
jgi:protein kinase A